LPDSLPERLSPATYGDFLPVTVASCLFSLDQPTRPGEHLRRNRQADLLCRFQIDDELEFFRLLDGQVSGLGSLENLVHICSGVPSATIRSTLTRTAIFDLWSNQSRRALAERYQGCDKYVNLICLPSATLQADVCKTVKRSRNMRKLGR